MTARSFTVRCSHCKTTQTVRGTLEEARQTRCGLCHQKTTVAAHRDGDGDMVQGEPSAVTTAPGIETAFWKMTPEQTEIARGLALSALGTE